MVLEKIKGSRHTAKSRNIQGERDYSPIQQDETLMSTPELEQMLYQYVLAITDEA